jgi:hypothetical protein
MKLPKSAKKTRMMTTWCMGTKMQSLNPQTSIAFMPFQKVVSNYSTYKGNALCFPKHHSSSEIDKNVLEKDLPRNNFFEPFYF